MKCSSTGRVSSPLVSGAVFLNYWRSRQFHPACQRAVQFYCGSFRRNRHEIFTSLYRHPGVGVITRQRGSVYHGGARFPISGSLFSGIKRASIMQRGPHFVSRILRRTGRRSDETIIMDQSFGKRRSYYAVRSINLHATLIAAFHFLPFASSSHARTGLGEGWHSAVRVNSADFRYKTNRAPVFPISAAAVVECD